MVFEVWYLPLHVNRIIKEYHGIHQNHGITGLITVNKRKYFWDLCFYWNETELKLSIDLYINIGDIRGCFHCSHMHILKD